jgi:hypothetical protein
MAMTPATTVKMGSTNIQGEVEGVESGRKPMDPEAPTVSKLRQDRQNDTESSFEKSHCGHFRTSVLPQASSERIEDPAFPLVSLSLSERNYHATGQATAGITLHAKNCSQDLRDIGPCLRRDRTLAEQAL